MTESPWRALANRRMLICVLTGFSSGLPLYLLLNLVPAWLKTEGLSLKAIGAFALIGIAGHEHDWHVGLIARRGERQRDAVHHGHQDVGKQQIVRPARASRARKRSQSFAAVANRLDFMADA